jgi:hypothetical protein
MEHLDSLFLLGSDFGALTSLDGSLKCVLVMEAGNRTISSLLSSQSRNAKVLNDQVTRCPLSSTEARQLSQYAGIVDLEIHPRLLLITQRPGQAQM